MLLSAVLHSTITGGASNPPSLAKNIEEEVSTAVTDPTHSVQLPPPAVQVPSPRERAIPVPASPAKLQRKGNLNL